MDIFSMGFRIIFGMIAVVLIGTIVLINLVITLFEYFSISKSPFPNKAQDEFVGAKKRLTVWLIAFAISIAYFLGSLAVVLL